MPVINTTQSGSAPKTYDILPADIYTAKIVRADYRENQFAELRKDGTPQMEVALAWEITELTAAQRRAKIDPEECGWLWMQFNPWYGMTKDGAPSKWKAFIDNLLEQGVLTDYDPNNFDTDCLLEIEQRLMVIVDVKKKGANVGQKCNRVSSVLPMNDREPREVAPPTKNAPQPIEALPQTAIIAGYVDDIRPATPYSGKRATSFRFTTRAGEAFYFVTTELARSDLQDDQDDSADDPENVSEIEYYTDSNGVNVATKWVCRAKPF